MLDAKNRARADQAIATMVELLPYHCRLLLEGFIKEGFTRQEALRLIETTITLTFGGQK